MECIDKRNPVKTALTRVLKSLLECMALPARNLRHSQNPTEEQPECSTYLFTRIETIQKRKGIEVDIQVGDIIRLKKKHPCGSSEWKVLRIGMDFRLECLGCGHMVMIPRKQAEKNLRGWMRDGIELPRDPSENTRSTRGRAEGEGGERK